jgi:hypothetical protein
MVDNPNNTEIGDMVEHVEHYQFSFFAPGAHVQPSPDIIARLLDTFKDKGFIPTTIQELQIGPITQVRLQLQLTTPQLEWNLAFEPLRVLLTKQNVARADSEIGGPADFVGEVVGVFSRLLQVLPLTGTRLSYVTKGLLPEMSPEVLQQVNLRLLNLPAFYLENPPVEWTTRNVARYEVSVVDKAEIFNVITDINRVQGTIQGKEGPRPFDRIQIGFDINTFHGNITPRFGANDVGPFLQEATKISQRISDEIGEKFNG